MIRNHNLNRSLKKQELASQARTSGSSFIGQLQAYLHIHAHALFSSLGRLIRSPFTSVMTIAVLALAIALAAGFYLLVLNVQQLTGNLESSNQISVFLKHKISDSAGDEIALQLTNHPEIQHVNVITKAKALDEFKKYSGFGEALNALDDNPLPTVIQILPKNTLEESAEIESLVAELQALPEVDFVQLDMQWVKRLQSIMDLIQRGVGLIGALLALAVLFITGNTIRLELQNRRDEVLIAKLVGATHSFIQRPFLYGGFWYGFLSGLLAWFVVIVMLLFLEQPVERLSALYHGGFKVIYPGFFDSLMLFLISSVLGISGALIVLCSQLHQLNPD